MCCDIFLIYDIWHITKSIQMLSYSLSLRITFRIIWFQYEWMMNEWFYLYRTFIRIPWRNQYRWLCHSERVFDLMRSIKTIENVYYSGLQLGGFSVAFTFYIAFEHHSKYVNVVDNQSRKETAWRVWFINGIQFLLHSNYEWRTRILGVIYSRQQTRWRIQNYRFFVINNGGNQPKNYKCKHNSWVYSEMEVSSKLYNFITIRKSVFTFS